MPVDLEAYEASQKQALHELVDAVYDHTGGYVNFKIRSGHAIEGRGFVAESLFDRWQIQRLVARDGGIIWKKYEKPRVSFEQVEGWQP